MKERVASTLKHAVVNNNKFKNQNEVANRQIIYSRFQHYKLMKSQIINYKKQSFHLYHMHYCMTNFRTKKRKIYILHKYFQNKYFLFKHFYFFYF